MILNLSRNMLNIKNVIELSKDSWEYVKYLISTNEVEKLSRHLFDGRETLEAVVIDYDCNYVLRVAVNMAKEKLGFPLLRVF